MSALERLTAAYAALVKAGRLTIEQVPEAIRANVQNSLTA